MIKYPCDFVSSIMDPVCQIKRGARVANSDCQGGRDGGVETAAQARQGAVLLGNLGPNMSVLPSFALDPYPGGSLCRSNLCGITMDIGTQACQVL